MALYNDYRVGYRLWQVLANDSPVLIGPRSSIVWWPAKNATGYRMVCLLGKHDAPHLACRCGFYARRYPICTEIGTISGAVALGGIVVEREDELRGQTARILGLVRPPCVWCGAPADALWFPPQDGDPIGFARWFYQNGAPIGFECCRYHADLYLSRGYRQASLEDLAAAYGVPLLETADALVSLVRALRA